jgi:carbonic anhydrase
MSGSGWRQGWWGELFPEFPMTAKGKSASPIFLDEDLQSIAIDEEKTQIC